MTFTILAVLAVAATAIFIVFNTNKRPPASTQVSSITSAATIRQLASWEIEANEDLDVINRRYMEERRRQREDEALTRLGPLVPVGATGRTK